MIIKILFSSALTLHRPWPPILISDLFHPSLFLSSWPLLFYTQGVFELDILLLGVEFAIQLTCIGTNTVSINASYFVQAKILVIHYIAMLLKNYILICLLTELLHIATLNKYLFLNQAHAGCKCAWFLGITFMWIHVCMCACVYVCVLGLGGIRKMKTVRYCVKIPRYN